MSKTAGRSPGPTKCDCQGCERFRKRMPDSRLTQAAFKALEKANKPRKNSRRARIEAGVGKSGEIPKDKPAEPAPVGA